MVATVVTTTDLGGPCHPSIHPSIRGTCVALAALLIPSLAAAGDCGLQYEPIDRVSRLTVHPVTGEARVEVDARRAVPTDWTLVVRTRGSAPVEFPLGWTNREETASFDLTSTVATPNLDRLVPVDLELVGETSGRRQSRRLGRRYLHFTANPAGQVRLVGVYTEQNWHLAAPYGILDPADPDRVRLEALGMPPRTWDSQRPVSRVSASVEPRSMDDDLHPGDTDAGLALAAQPVFPAQVTR